MKENQLENEIFKKANIDFKKIEKYGFRKEKDFYVFEKKFFDNEFNAIIKINKKGLITGKVIDEETGEEYLGLRTTSSGTFKNQVLDAYKSILIDIKNSCFDSKPFIGSQTNRIAIVIEKKYNSKPEFLWEKYPDYAVFRKRESQKWFGIITNVDSSKMGINKGEVELINVKVDKVDLVTLLEKKGIFEAYHMNKKSWISIILNDTLDDTTILDLIDKSYSLVK